MVYAVPAGTWVRTSGFGIRVHPITGMKKLHTAVDFAGPVGTHILAAADGRVTFAGPASGYGHLILIEHTVAGQRVATGYAHMYADGIRVQAGIQSRLGSTSPMLARTATQPDHTCTSRFALAARMLLRPTRAEPGLSDEGLACDRYTPCPMRQVWVADPAGRSGVKRPGLLVMWRRTHSGAGWEAPVLFGAELRSGEWQ